MRISDWSSDVCSSDLPRGIRGRLSRPSFVVGGRLPGGRARGRVDRGKAEQRSARHRAAAVRPAFDSIRGSYARMSFQAINWAYKQTLGGGIKFTLVTLANYADEDGTCFPRHETLAEQTGHSLRTIVNR